MKQPTMILFAAALLAACGGSDGNGEDLIGTWGGSTFSITFHPDGTVDFVEGSAARNSGTWEADGHRLTLVGISVEVGSLTYDYVIETDTLMFDAHRPDGATDGVIGTWRAELGRDDQTVETTIELEAGGTGHITATGSIPSEEIDAELAWTVSIDGTRLELDWDNPDGSSTLRTMFAFPDVAIGGLPLPRVPD
jgi:hypothetical protein